MVPRAVETRSSIPVLLTWTKVNKPLLALITVTYRGIPTVLVPVTVFRSMARVVVRASLRAR